MKTSTRPLLSSLLVLALLLASHESRAAVFTYDFEQPPLNIGALSGQDNWGSSGSSPFIVTSGSGFDTTQVIGTGGSIGSNFATRVNDGNFSFGSLVGVTSLTLGFDTRYVNGGNGGINNQSHFSISSASGSTGSPFFGLEGNNLTLNNVAFALPGSLNFDDWISLRLVMDLTANSGDGSGSLFYKNLTDGESSYAAVSGMQNINLNLDPLQDPTQWNRMVLRTGFYEGNKIDNLYIETSSAVPEPSRALLAALGLTSLVLRRRR